MELRRTLWKGSPEGIGVRNVSHVSCCLLFLCFCVREAWHGSPDLTPAETKRRCNNARSYAINNAFFQGGPGPKGGVGHFPTLKSNDKTCERNVYKQILCSSLFMNVISRTPPCTCVSSPHVTQVQRIDRILAGIIWFRSLFFSGKGGKCLSPAGNSF